MMLGSTLSCSEDREALRGLNDDDGDKNMDEADEEGLNCITGADLHESSPDSLFDCGGEMFAEGKTKDACRS